MSGEMISFRWPAYVMFAVKEGNYYEPYITEGDKFDFWVHVEFDEGRAHLCSLEFKKLREQGKSLQPDVIGSMTVPVNSLPELKKYTEHLTMKTVGFICNLKINEETEVFEGTYIRWKNVHDFTE